MAAMEAPADDDPDWIVATDAFGKWMYDHASDLLADPAPSVPVEQPPPTCGDSDHRHYGPCEVYATASPVVEAGEADRPATPSGAAQLSEEEAEADRAALASPEGVVTPEPPPFGSVPFGTMFIPGPALLHGYNEWVDVPGPFTVPPKDLVPYQPEDPKHG